jgi:hypothetical protein
MLGGEVITRDDLIVSKLMGQDITKYKSLFPHVSAAIQSSYEDKHPSKGDTIKYIYADGTKEPIGYRQDSCIDFSSIVILLRRSSACCIRVGEVDAAVFLACCSTIEPHVIICK